jgi:anti-sigma factor RsiW
MNCDNIINHIDDYSDAALSPVEALSVRRHLEECPACAARLREIAALKKALASLPAPVPEPDVLERLLTAAVQTAAPPANRDYRWSTWQRAGLATAAGLLLAIVFFVGVKVGNRSQADAPAQIAMTAAPIEVGPAAGTVGLMFRTAEALPGASISVWLPDDVQIAGRPDVRYVTWHTDLKAGPNLLELPLQSTGPNGGMLVVRLSQGSLVRTLEVPVAVRSSKGPA